MSEDGVCGINYEHTTSEGVAVVTVVQNIFKDLQMDKNKSKDEAGIRTGDFYELFEWKLDDEVKAAIANAAENINKYARDFVRRPITYQGLHTDSTRVIVLRYLRERMACDELMALY